MKMWTLGRKILDMIRNHKEQKIKVDEQKNNRTEPEKNFDIVCPQCRCKCDKDSSYNRDATTFCSYECYRIYVGFHGTVRPS